MLLGDQRFQLVCERGQTLREQRGRVGLDLPVGNVAEAVAVGFDDRPARGAQAGIEAENPQASFSSSSSGTS